MVEVVVAHQAAKRLAAELTILLLINFLEQRALIPAGTLVTLQGATQLLLGDAYKADFEHLVSFSVVHQIAQATPGAFQRLKLRMVNNLIHLLRQLFVDLRDQRLNGAIGIAGDGNSVLQRLLRQGFHRAFDRGTRLIAFWPELFIQQRAELILTETGCALRLRLL